MVRLKSKDPGPLSHHYGPGSTYLKVRQMGTVDIVREQIPLVAFVVILLVTFVLIEVRSALR